MLEDLCLLHNGKSSSREFSFHCTASCAKDLKNYIICKAIRLPVLRLLPKDSYGAVKVVSIRDRIYGCAIFLRLLEICLDNLQVVILWIKRNLP